MHAALLVAADRAEALGCLPGAEVLRSPDLVLALRQAYPWRQGCRDALLGQLCRLAWDAAPEELRTAALAAIYPPSTRRS